MGSSGAFLRVIGGRVLDASALTAFAEQRSVYLSAAVWTAVEEDVVLLVPATALLDARMVVAPVDLEVLDVLLGLHVVILDVLDRDPTLAVAELARTHDLEPHAAHAAHCAAERGWPLITARPGSYRALGDAVVMEDLP